MHIASCAVFEGPPPPFDDVVALFRGQIAPGAAVPTAGALRPTRPRAPGLGRRPALQTRVPHPPHRPSRARLRGRPAPPHGPAHVPRARPPPAALGDLDRRGARGRGVGRSSASCTTAWSTASVASTSSRWCSTTSRTPDPSLPTSGNRSQRSRLFACSPTPPGSWRGARPSRSGRWLVRLALPAGARAPGRGSRWLPRLRRRAAVHPADVARRCHRTQLFELLSAAGLWRRGLAAVRLMLHSGITASCAPPPMTPSSSLPMSRQPGETTADQLDADSGGHAHASSQSGPGAVRRRRSAARSRLALPSDGLRRRTARRRCARMATVMPCRRPAGPARYVHWSSPASLGFRLLKAEPRSGPARSGHPDEISQGALR